MGKADSGTGRLLRLAHRRLAPESPGAAGAVPATLRPGQVAAPGIGGGPGLDLIGPGPGGSRSLLRQVQRGRGRALLLRTFPRGLRPRPAEAARRLVHPRRGGALHGRPRRPGPEGRPGHRGRAGRRERLRARSLLRHRGLPGRDAEADRRQPGGQGSGRPHRGPG